MIKVRVLEFLPESYVEKRNLHRKRKLVITALLVSALAAGVLVVIPFKLKSDLLKEKNLWDEQLKKVENTYSTGKQYDYLLNQVELREQAAKTLDLKGINILSVLSHLEKNSPQKVMINSIGVSEVDKAVNINLGGSAASNDDITAFVRALEKDTFFSSVNISSLTDKNLGASPKSSRIFVIELKINLGM